MYVNSNTNAQISFLNININIKEWSFSKKAALLILGVGITVAGGTVAAALTFKAAFIVGGIGAAVGLIITGVALYHLFCTNLPVSLEQINKQIDKNTGENNEIFSEKQAEAIKEEIIAKLDLGQSIDDLIVKFISSYQKQSMGLIDRNGIVFLKSIVKNYSPEKEVVHEVPTINYQLEEGGKELFEEWLDLELLSPPVEDTEIVKVNYGNCEKDEGFPYIEGSYNPDEKSTKIKLNNTKEADAIIFFGEFEQEDKLLQKFDDLEKTMLNDMGYDKQYNLLSNYHDRKITIGDQTYKTREHALQSMKFNHYFMDSDLTIPGIGTIEKGENVRDFLANLQCKPNDVRKAAGAIQRHLEKEFPDDKWKNYVNVDNLERTIREQRVIIFHAFFNKDGTVNENGRNLYERVGDKYLYEGNYRRNITKRSDQKYGAEFLLDNNGNKFTLVGHNILGRVSKEACNYIGKIPKNNNNN